MVRTRIVVGVVAAVAIVAVVIGLVVYLTQSGGSSTLQEEMFEPKEGVSEDLYKIPDGFLIGIGSCAYQSEGAWNESRKSLSLLDAYYHARPVLINGDIATDSYHQYKKDIELIKQMKMQAFRFSFSWTRLLPGGSQDQGPDPVAVQHYSTMLDELLAANIQPIVTVYHWDMPVQYFQEGGWLDSKIQDRLVDYADFLFKTFGDKVKHWNVINEPHVICDFMHERNYIPPALNLPGVGYLCMHNVILAHAKVYRLYESRYKASQGGLVGTSMDMDWVQPRTDSQADKDAAERMRVFMFAWFADPIMFGHYPKLMRDIVDANSLAWNFRESRLPTFTAEETKMIKGAIDFLGLNHYSTMLAWQGNRTASTSEISIVNDTNVDTIYEGPNWVKSATNPVCPWGLRDLLRWIKNRYNNPSVFITEVGYAGLENEDPNDPQRAGFFSAYMRAAMRAVNEDGCNIHSFLTWSLMDTFEWDRGHTYRTGLVHVDFDSADLKRTPKNSTKFLTTINENRHIHYEKPVPFVG